ncbi:MAG: nuclear transport factor 2 family protein [Alphaproteobacteria bacterium]|nr:nuclear transport factor 2 family protein [Alphaproteobacteria bacterium]
MISKKVISKALMVLFAVMAVSMPQVAANDSTERMNEQIVRNYLQTLPSLDMPSITKYLADDVVHTGLMPGMPPIKGREEFNTYWANMIKGVERQTIEIRRVKAMGSTVLAERIDTVWGDGEELTFHLTTLFVVKEGKIVEFREYMMPGGGMGM